jgi:hypothetical protein
MMATRKCSVPSLTADEKRWRARSDADTLAQAEEIKADRARNSAAKSYASKEAQRYQKVAQGKK